MRRLFALLTAASLLGGMGCIHETCDCCADICCGHTTVHAPSGKPEEIKKMPAAKEGAAKPEPGKAAPPPEEE